MPGPYTYFNNIPQAGDDPSVSQPQLLANFGSIESLLNINHVDFASPDAGKHTAVNLTQQGAAPTFASPETGIFNIVSALTGFNETFIHKYSNNGAANGNIPFTASILSTSTPSAGQPGWCYLASGLIIKFGTYTTISTAIQTITFPVAANIPVFNTILWAAVIGRTSDGTDSVATLQTYSTVNLTAKLSALGLGPNQIFYIAIGY